MLKLAGAWVAVAAGVGLAAAWVGGGGVGAAGVAVAVAAASTVAAGGGVGVAVAPSWANTTLKLAEAKTKMTSSEIALNHDDLAAILPPYIQLLEPGCEK